MEPRKTIESVKLMNGVGSRTASFLPNVVVGAHTKWAERLQS